MKGCLRFSCFVLLFSVIHHLPPRAEPGRVLQSSRQTSAIRLLRIKLGVRFLVSLRFYSRHVRTLLQSVTHPGCRCKHKCAPFMDVVCIIKTICQSLFASNGEKNLLFKKCQYWKGNAFMIKILAKQIMKCVTCLQYL